MDQRIVSQDLNRTQSEQALPVRDADEEPLFGGEGAGQRDERLAALVAAAEGQRAAGPVGLDARAVLAKRKRKRLRIPGKQWFLLLFPKYTGER